MTGESADRQEGGRGERPPSPGSSIFLILMVLVCCGLPILLVSAGSLTFLAAVTGSLVLFLAGILIAALLVIGVAVRRRNRIRRVRPSGGT